MRPWHPIPVRQSAGQPHRDRLARGERRIRLEDDGPPVVGDDRPAGMTAAEGPHDAEASRQIARVSGKGFGIYFFAIPRTAFALFWTTMASWGASEMQDETGFLSWAFPLFGVPFILIGLGMLSAPFLPLFNKGKVVFAVTNQRIIRLRLGRKLDVNSVPARRIGHIERNENRDGSGTLKIAISVGTDSDGDKHTEYFELGEVENVLEAHDEVAELGRRVAERDHT